MAKISKNIVPGLTITLGQLKASTSRLLANKSTDELISVIDHLSHMAERLKLENEELSKNGSGSSKYSDLVKEIKSLKKEKADAAEAAKARAVADNQVHK
jgi:hypothetical protein